MSALQTRNTIIELTSTLPPTARIAMITHKPFQKCLNQLDPELHCYAESKQEKLLIVIHALMLITTEMQKAAQAV